MTTKQIMDDCQDHYDNLQPPEFYLSNNDDELDEDSEVDEPTCENCGELLDECSCFDEVI